MRRQMLATAKTDFEFERAVVPEKHGCINRPIRHGERRQQFLHERRLSLAQFMSGAPTIKAANGDGIAYASAAFRSATRSVRSHGKKSPSAFCPK